MIDFKSLAGLSIPEGVVTKIHKDGTLLWTRDKFRYVSFGDSIAAGHSINDRWATDYGTESQFHVTDTNPDAQTTIVPGCYTDLIDKELRNIFGNLKVQTKSFACSGMANWQDDPKDKDIDFRYALEDSRVMAAISNADLVTFCLGANTVLGPAMSHIMDFVSRGNPALNDLDNLFETSFDKLAANETVEGSYRNIFKKLTTLNTNPTSRFIFTTIYNPMQYLWCEPSHNGNSYTTGYFSPIVSWFWDVKGFELWGQKIDLRQFVYEVEVPFPGVGSFSFKKIVERIDDPYGDGRLSLGQWVENKLLRLNSILAQAIEDYGDSRILLADTKAVFDRAPDRGVPGGTEYNNWVNVDITRKSKVNDLAWNAVTNKYGDVSTIMGKMAEDSAFKDELFMYILSTVIMPELDPHPREYGQDALYRAFADVIRKEISILSSFPALYRYTVHYAANGASGSMGSEEVVGLDSTAFMVLKPLGYSHPTTGYRFVGWQKNSGGAPAAYYDEYGQFEYYYTNISADTIITAQWSNMYTVAFFKRCNDYAGNVIYKTNAASQTGVQEIYGVDISYDNGSSWSTLGTDYYRGYFDSKGTNIKAISSISFPYGTKLRVWVTHTRGDKLPIVGTYKYKETSSHIYKGTTLDNVGPPIIAIKPTAVITLKADAAILFEWALSGVVYKDATANWNAYIIGTSPVS